MRIRHRGVRTIPGVNYRGIDDDGLLVEIDELDAKRAIKQGSELAAVI
jgi:hypothetical protein